MKRTYDGGSDEIAVIRQVKESPTRIVFLFGTLRCGVLLAEGETVTCGAKEVLAITLKLLHGWN